MTTRVAADLEADRAYRLGREDGAKDERARIVAWLRARSESAVSPSRRETLDEAATLIEAGKGSDVA